MKKHHKKPISTPRLSLRREQLVRLAPEQLSRAVAGQLAGTWPPYGEPPEREECA